MEAIKDTVINVIEGWMAKTGGQDKYNLEAVLKTILTKKELEHIRLSYVKRGVVGIAVDSSVWLYNLTLQKEELLAKIHQKSGAMKIKDIRFRLGEIR